MLNRPKFDIETFEPIAVERPVLLRAQLYTALGLLAGGACALFVSTMAWLALPLLLLMSPVVIYGYLSMAYDLEWNEEWLVLRNRFLKNKYQAYPLAHIGEVLFFNTPSNKSYHRWEFKVGWKDTQAYSTVQRGLMKEQANVLIEATRFLEDKGIAVKFKTGAKPIPQKPRKAYWPEFLMGAVFPLILFAIGLVFTIQEERFYERLNTKPAYAVGYTNGTSDIGHGSHAVLYEFYGKKGYYPNQRSEQYVSHYYSEGGNATEEFYMRDDCDKPLSALDSIKTMNGLYLVVYSQEYPNVNRIILTEPLEGKDTVAIKQKAVDPKYLEVWD